MISRRRTVALLAGASAAIAGLVGAVSLTRIAGSHLGFPPGLAWTLTGAVDVAAIAGGVMWAGFRGRVRRIGQPMNIVCTAVSGVGVGLDHAANAAHPWPWPAVAFAVGLFIPLLFTWLLHALAVIGDQTAPARPAPLRAQLAARWAELRGRLRRSGGAAPSARVADGPATYEPVRATTAAAAGEPRPDMPPDMPAPAADPVLEPSPPRAARGSKRAAGIEWARAHWPCTGSGIAAAVGVSKPEGDRIRAIVRDERKADAS